MRLVKKLILFIVLLSGVFMAAAKPASEKIPADIYLAFQTGDAKLLADYFNQNVELVVLSNDNVYSKAQAQQIVSNFFSNFQPISFDEEKGQIPFSIIHQSGRGDAQSVIGKLKTGKGDFRVYFLLKKNSGKDYIHQLRIEKQ